MEVSQPGEKVRHRLSRQLSALLLDLDDWQDAEVTSQSHRIVVNQREGLEALDELISLGLLEVNHQATTPDEVRADVSVASFSIWHHWGPFIQQHHAASRDARYPVTSQERDALVAEVASHGERPSTFKRYPDLPRMLLPRSLPPLSMPLEHALRARRTHRVFKPEPISVDELSSLLHLTFGVQRMVNARDFGVLQLRTSPSAGARHEVRSYLAVFDVSGVPQGLYHYNVESHSLSLLEADLTRDRVAEMTYSQTQFEHAPVIFFTTAVMQRLAWKYWHPRAYRLWMYDAGHYGQTFALVATGLGLGAFQTAAFLDSKVEEVLGLTGGEEFAAYALACGHPADPRPDGLPTTYTGSPLETRGHNRD